MMSSEAAEFVNAFLGEPKEAVQIATGEVISDDPLKIQVGGADVAEYRINAELELSAGDVLLCLIYGGGIYIICKLEG